MLAELERLLVGMNYVVSLRLYRLPYRPEASIDWYVAGALGPKAVLRTSGPATRREILADVEFALRYEGDEAAGPQPQYRRSPRFRELLQGVLTELDQAIMKATTLGSFELREGHPVLYPVWWGFGYVVAGPAEAMVFIGAGSD